MERRVRIEEERKNHAFHVPHMVLLPASISQGRVCNAYRSRAATGKKKGSATPVRAVGKYYKQPLYLHTYVVEEGGRLPSPSTQEVACCKVCLSSFKSHAHRPSEAQLYDSNTMMVFDWRCDTLFY
jgi:hypothetical protein